MPPTGSSRGHDEIVVKPRGKPTAEDGADGRRITEGNPRLLVAAQAAALPARVLPRHRYYDGTASNELAVIDYPVASPGCSLLDGCTLLLVCSSSRM